MRYRLVFLAVTGFFITMNVLLWRSEFAGRGRFGTMIPPKVVWDKVLTSPDNSFLEIRHHGTKVGRGNWVASIREALADMPDAGVNLPPEGMIKHVTGYRLDFDGSLTLEALPRLRFYFSLTLDTNQVWKNLDLRVHLKPMAWEIDAQADTQKVRVNIQDEDGRTEYIYTFAELRHPEKILRELAGPAFPALWGLLGLPLTQSTPAEASLALEWQGRLDRLRLGHSDIRVYRLEARLFDRFKAVIFVSPVGEILRLELPDEILLINDGMTAL